MTMVTRICYNIYPIFGKWIEFGRQHNYNNAIRTKKNFIEKQELGLVLANGVFDMCFHV
jgi:hypothetical protein